MTTPADAPLNQRLFDLVRYSRGPLHDAGLISDEEYAELLNGNGVVARLHAYDEVVARFEVKAQSDAADIEHLWNARRAETKRADKAGSLVWMAMQILKTRILEATGDEGETLRQWLADALPVALQSVENAERLKQSADEPESGARVEMQPEPALCHDEAPKNGHPARAVDAALSSLDDLAPCPDCGGELVETSRPDATTLRDYLCIRCGFNLQNIDERPTIGVAGWTKERAEEIRLKHAAAYAENLVRRADLIVSGLMDFILRNVNPKGLDDPIPDVVGGEDIGDWIDDSRDAVLRAVERLEAKS